jgi:hypothetical protein
MMRTQTEISMPLLLTRDAVPIIRTSARSKNDRKGEKRGRRGWSVTGEKLGGRGDGRVSAALPHIAARLTSAASLARFFFRANWVRIYSGPSERGKGREEPEFRTGPA